ncbi:TPA: hypothetical protein ACPJ0Q_002812 [Vibrio diabolicus]
MSEVLDVKQVLSDVVEGVRTILDTEQPKLRSFIRSQARGAVEYSALIAEGVVKSEITEAQVSDYLEKLEDQITAASHIIAGATVAIIEAVWNKIVDIIWTAIGAAITTVIDIALPIPDFGVDN